MTTWPGWPASGRGTAGASQEIDLGEEGPVSLEVGPIIRVEWPAVTMEVPVGLAGAGEAK